MVNAIYIYSQFKNSTFFQLEDGSKIEHSEERSGMRRIKPTTLAGERSSAVQLYSKDHELARRTLANSMWELFLRFNGPEMRKMLSEKERESWGRQVCQN
jgi:hypothetical protein